MSGKTFTPALVVVDFQEDFCPPNGALAVTNGRDIAPIINQLMDLPFAIKIATMDWHPEDHVSFATNHAAPHNTPFETVINVKNPLAEEETEDIRLWPPHCIASSHGAELIREFRHEKTDLIVKKGQDKRVETFSAFRDNYKTRVSESKLASALKEAGTTDVYVVGLATDYCVKHTALHAVDEGYNTFIVTEATKAVDQSEKAMHETKQELASRGVRYTSIDGDDMKAVRSLSPAKI